MYFIYILIMCYIMFFTIIFNIRNSWFGTLRLLLCVIVSKCYWLAYWQLFWFCIFFSFFLSSFFLSFFLFFLSIFLFSFFLSFFLFFLSFFSFFLFFLSYLFFLSFFLTCYLALLSGFCYFWFSFKVSLDTWWRLKPGI
jgi:hypothetical protein